MVASALLVSTLIAHSPVSSILPLSTAFEQTERFITEEQLEEPQTLKQLLDLHSVTEVDRARALRLLDNPSLHQGSVVTRSYSGDSTLASFTFDSGPELRTTLHLSSEFGITQQPIAPEIRIDAAAGTIESSLYHTVQKLGAHTELSLLLADIFAWEIDFYKVDPNDGFKVVYEAEVIRGREKGIRNILAAHFEHAGELFTAYYFERDGLRGYFTADGKPLKKAFLQAPLEYTRVSSRYSKSRFHPVLKQYIPHLGTDYAAPVGTPVRAVGEGVVTLSGYSARSGLNVKIAHGEEYATGYLHLSRIATGIKKGKRITQGQVIGYVGATGLATGPHLCFRFWKEGRQVDPFKEKIENRSSIPRHMAASFKAQVAKMDRLLQSLHIEEKPQLLVSNI